MIGQDLTIGVCAVSTTLVLQAHTECNQIKIDAAIGHLYLEVFLLFIFFVSLLKFVRVLLCLDKYM